MKDDRSPGRARPFGVWLVAILALAAVVLAGVALVRVLADPSSARVMLGGMGAPELAVEVIGVLVFLVGTVQLFRLQGSAVAWFGAAFFLYPLGTLTAWAIDGPPSALPSLVEELIGWAVRLGLFGYSHRLGRLGVLD